MRSLRFLKPLLGGALIAALVAAGYLTRDYWSPLVQYGERAVSENPPSVDGEDNAPTRKVVLSDQAIANLGVRAKPVQPEIYWRTIQVPGMVVDRPGRSDRGVVSP